MKQIFAGRTPVQSWENWLKFLQKQGIGEMTAAEYYELRLPRKDAALINRQESCEQLAEELLRDFVVTGALQLPTCVKLEKTRAHLNYKGYMLLDKKKRPSRNIWASEGEVLLWVTSEYFHEHLKMGDATMEEILDRYRCAILNLYN
jgi:hypothetical protein